MNTNSSRFDTVARFLDVASLRHRVIAHNVANVNTPGFHRLDVSFEQAFEQAMGRGNVSAALAVRPEVSEANGGPERADGNNVDIDHEMGRLNKNTLLYRTFTQVLASYLGTARSAISGR